MSYQEGMEKFCANCGDPIPEGADPRRMYCDARCKKAYNRLDADRGQEILALLQVAMKYRHPKNDEERDLARYARQQSDELLRRYRDLDAENGRNAELLVRARYERGDLVCDKEKKPKIAAVSVERIRQGLGAV